MMQDFEAGKDPLSSDRTLRDYVDVVLRRRWAVLAIFLVALSSTILYTYTRTPLYSSIATIELEEKSSKVKDKDSVYGAPEYDQFKGYLSTQLELLKSRSLAEALVDRMNLVGRSESTANGWFSSLHSRVVGDESPQTASALEAKRNSIAATVLKRTSAKPIKQSNLIEVRMDATDPSMAQDSLRNYLDLFLERNLEKRRTDSLQSAAWLKEELEHVEKKLRQAKVTLFDFTVQHGIIDSQDGGVHQVLSILTKTLEGRVRSQEARAKVQALDQQSASGDSAMLMSKEVNSEYIGKLKQDLAMMESEYQQMRGIYSPTYPKLRMLEKKIKFLTDRIAQMEKSLVSSALDLAKKEEKLLEGSYDSAKKEVERIKSLENQYASLRKDVDTNTEFQKILLKEYKQMDIRARTVSNDARIVDSPTRPTAPSWPKKRPYFLVGCLIGVVAGIAVAFAVDQLDDTIRTPREIEADLKVRRLGVVPDIEQLPRPNGQSPSSLVPAHEFEAHGFPRSPIADAVRNIQTSIFFSNPDHAVQCLGVSSATPSEGKTFIAVSIATVLAKDGGRTVLLVDADLRKPRVHKLFNQPDPGQGLATILHGNSIEIPSLISDCHWIRGLSFLAAGPLPDDPVSLLHSDRARSIFASLKSAYDYVVIDTPPILGFSDTLLLSHFMDGLVMVARQGHVGRDELRDAMQLISSANGCPILGVVLNRAPTHWKYGYGSRYGSHYYYSHYKYYSRKT